MAYRVDLTARAERDLRQIDRSIDRLEHAVGGLEDHPSRGAVVPEDSSLRQLFHGRKPHLYRIIYVIDEADRSVAVLHIGHGARDAFAA